MLSLLFKSSLTSVSHGLLLQLGFTSRGNCSNGLHPKKGNGLLPPPSRVSSESPTCSFCISKKAYFSTLGGRRTHQPYPGFLLGLESKQLIEESSKGDWWEKINGVNVFTYRAKASLPICSRLAWTSPCHEDLSFIYYLKVFFKEPCTGIENTV